VLITLVATLCCRFTGYPKTGGAAQDFHVTPGYRPQKQTFSHSTMD